MTEAARPVWLKPWTATTRLAVSIAIGIGVLILLRQMVPAPLAGILAWDAGVLCFLFLTYRVMPIAASTRCGAGRRHSILGPW